MDVVERGADLRARLREDRVRERSIGLVPTMGALHKAHLALAEQARGENDVVVMSLFVNPAQFGAGEDYERYPRPRSRDEELARESGLVDILFAPTMDEVYPNGMEGQTVWIDPGPLGERLEGTSRPGHFRGVGTVVAKLFNAVEPDRAYFGQKDAQQLAVLRAMVRDLALPVEIRAVRTVREADGLALSSRNAYLSPEERAQASSLYAAIEWAHRQVTSGVRDTRAIEMGVRAEIESQAPLARIDYVAIVDADTFEPVPAELGPLALLALAVRFGHTRLIDNALLTGMVKTLPEGGARASASSSAT